MQQLKELQNYTRDAANHGLNRRDILEKFISYSQLCRDPFNIFRYMEEKAICIFMPSFWIQKANYLQKIGDYRNSFECLNQASCRSGIPEDGNEAQSELIDVSLEIQLKRKHFRHKLIQQMRRYPLKGKRSVEQFQLLNKQNIQKFGIDSVKENLLINLYQSKYKGLKSQKQQFQLKKQEQLHKSWLFDTYQQEDNQEQRIQQMIHQNSIRQSKQIRHHSMHTPIKIRDPIKFTHTMDSVEIIRKKRSTQEKYRRNRQNTDKDDFSEEEDQTKMVSSVPVGRKFIDLKRRVTFDMDSVKKIQKMKKEDSQSCSSLYKNANTPQLLYKSSQSNALQRNRCFITPKDSQDS